MRSIGFCEFSAYSFSYFDCLFLSSPRSSLRSFFFAATAVAFSSASLALVSASSAMAPSQDRNSASPATLLPARHPSQATSIFLHLVRCAFAGSSTKVPIDRVSETLLVQSVCYVFHQLSRRVNQSVTQVAQKTQLAGTTLVRVRRSGVFCAHCDWRDAFFTSLFKMLNLS